MLRARTSVAALAPAFTMRRLAGSCRHANRAIVPVRSTTVTHALDSSVIWTPGPLRVWLRWSRGWPLLAGECGHCEAAAGRDARPSSRRWSAWQPAPVFSQSRCGTSRIGPRSSSTWPADRLRDEAHLGSRGVHKPAPLRARRRCIRSNTRYAGALPGRSPCQPPTRDLATQLASPRP